MKTMYMIGNAHLDPVWLWQWPEGLQAMRATFQSALDRLDETEDFVFTSSQTAMYAMIEETDPAMFAAISQRVAEGRWVIVGGWWVQPDCNLPSGEGFVRQSLYGQRYLMEKFNITTRVGYNVDSFGHAQTLPQILKLSGMDYYVFMRPGPHEKPDLPGRLFQWESPDGSRVVAYQIPNSYNSSWGKDLAQKIIVEAEELSSAQPLLMCFYGVGNHGGGPTKENIRTIQQAAGDNDDKRNIRFGDPASFFAEVDRLDLALPTVKDDLQHHASGCYSVHSAIKRDNRRAEHALASAEKLAVTATLLTGAPYPQGPLTQGWHDVLFNHFHDILAGTSIREAYADAAHLYGEALSIAARVENLALQRLASQIDCSGEGTPLVIWNPTGHRRQESVKVEFMWPADDLAVFTDHDEEVCYQDVDVSAVIRPGWRRGITLPVDVPPLGYRVYYLRPCQPTARVDQPVVVGKYSLTNAFLHVEIDPTTGSICTLRLLDQDWDALSGLGAVPVVFHDDSDTWSHGVFAYDKESGRFGDAEVNVVETGPLKGCIRAISHYGKSVVTQEFTLYADQAHMDVRVLVDWQEQHRVLKLEFPVAVADPQPTYEIPFGSIDRPADGEEEPGLHWFSVAGTSEDGQRRGLTVANDAKYSYDVRQQTMHLTVLRSPVYAHHIPREVEKGAFYHYIDQGPQEFTYRIKPHQGTWQDANAPRLGHELNVPLKPLEEANHPGQLGPTFSLLASSEENIVVSAVKQAEDGGDCIVRVYESWGKAVTATFTWRNGALTWTSTFRPFEIKTLAINESGTQVVEVDLLERPK